jgi:hypothetical protein
MSNSHSDITTNRSLRRSSSGIRCFFLYTEWSTLRICYHFTVKYLYRLQRCRIHETSPLIRHPHPHQAQARPTPYTSTHHRSLRHEDPPGHAPLKTLNDRSAQGGETREIRFQESNPRAVAPQPGDEPPELRSVLTVVLILSW